MTRRLLSLLPALVLLGLIGRLAWAACPDNTTPNLCLPLTSNTEMNRVIRKLDNALLRDNSNPPACQITLKNYAFASLPTSTAVAGDIVYCTDCVAGASPCAGSGLGAIAFRTGTSAWSCGGAVTTTTTTTTTSTTL